MAYSYRLNVEDIFLKYADECWQRAKSNMKEIKDEDPETNKEIIFLAPDDEQTISDCVLAIVGWAVCLESYVNFVWKTDEEIKDNKDDFENKNTSEKLKYILKSKEIDLSDKNWLAGIQQLFLARNNLVHFKDIVKHQGFSFAPKYQKDLSLNNLEKYRSALKEAIKSLNHISGQESKLLNGKFEIFYYDD